MAIQFNVSAPGKVILNGEHSVVYNKPALAGVIQLRNSIRFTETENDFVTINFDLYANVTVIYMLTALNSLLSDLSAKFESPDLRTELELRHDEYLSIVESFVQKNTHFDGLNENQLQVVLKASTAVVYLLSALEINDAKSKATTPILTNGFNLDFDSEIPAGAGLGSSSSFAVCTAAAFHIYAITHSKPDFINSLEDGEGQQANDFYETVSSWAFLSERIMHGTPSGLDNTICTFGNVLKFTKHPKKFEVVIPKSKINIMLINTGVSRNTLEVVRNVRNLRERHTQMIDHILNAMGSLVDDVVEVLENKNNATEDECHEELKRLFVINNNLLRALGVSHPKLEEIFSICERHGFASKLTGAGAGGFAIVLLPSSYANDKAFLELAADLIHFDTTVTSIAGDGLKIRQN